MACSTSWMGLCMTRFVSTRCITPCFLLIHILHPPCAQILSHLSHHDTPCHVVQVGCGSPRQDLPFGYLPNQPLLTFFAQRSGGRYMAIGFVSNNACRAQSSRFPDRFVTYDALRNCKSLSDVSSNVSGDGWRALQALLLRLSPLSRPGQIQIDQVQRAVLSHVMEEERFPVI